MPRMRVPSLIAAFAVVTAAVAGAGGARAQTWEAQPPSDMASSAAVLRWQTGAALAARCSEGVFSLLFAAVHDGERYPAHYRVDGGRWEHALWTPAARDRLFSSSAPARMARKVAAGGQLELRFTPEGEPPVLYQLDLPSDHGALNAVISDCGLPLSDPRDALIMVENPQWMSRPDGQDLARHYPGDVRQGDSAMLCTVNRAGRLEDCETTYETPPGRGVGDASLALAPRFRLRNPDGALEGQVIVIPIRWLLS